MRTAMEGGGVEEARTAPTRWIRGIASAATVSLLSLTGLAVGIPAHAQVAAASANYSGYATGSDVHTGAITTGPTTLADVEEAFSGAAVNSQGLTQIVDTDLADQPLVQAAAAGEDSGARGSGVEVGVAPPAPLTNQIILSQLATATAPPNSGLVSKQIGPISLDPVLEAQLLQGTAQANWATGGCVLGTPISQGTGEAENLGLVGTSGSNPMGTVGTSNVASTTSAETLVPQVNSAGAVVGNNVGLESSVTEQLAPVVIGGAVTVTVGGPWKMTAVATGIPGSSYVSLAPTNPNILNGSEPAVTITGPANAVLLSLTFQQLVGGAGLNVNLPGLLTLSVGAPPRAIGGAPGSAPAIASDGTSVAAAADLVQLTVGIPGVNVADVRIGHMVVNATVPAGGIACPIPVSKTANPATVSPGDSFQYQITVTNPYNCTLSNIKVVDTTKAPSGVLFSITGESPTADSVSGGVVTWNNVGSLAPGASTTLTISATIASNSGGGTLTDTAAVTGSCGIGNANGTATVGLPLSGSLTVTTPAVQSGNGAALPVTGGLDGRYYAVALLIGLAAVGFGRKGIMALFGSKS